MHASSASFNHMLSVSDEVLVYPQAQSAAFLRVKLGGDQIVPDHDATEGYAVLGDTSHQAFIIRFGIVAMDEVKVGVLRYPFKHR